MSSSTKRLIIEFKWIITVGLLTCIIIAILRFTDWRPFGYSNKAESVNYTLEALSFSVLAAIIFWFVNDFSNYRKRRTIALDHINRQVWSIREYLRIMIDSIDPFSLEPKRYTLKSFKEVFNKKDLYGGFYGGSRSIVDVYTDYKKTIESISEELLASYSEYMTVDEMKYLNEILGSFLIRNPITPMDFSLPAEEQHFFPSNQEKIGESIYRLSRLKWPR